MSADGGRNWLQWILATLILITGSCLIFVYSVLSTRMDRSEARMDAFATASLADRRDLATKQAEMTSTQVAQFSRILAELSQLRSDISRLERR